MVQGPRKKKISKMAYPTMNERMIVRLSDTTMPAKDSLVMFDSHPAKFKEAQLAILVCTISFLFERSYSLPVSQYTYK